MCLYIEHWQENWGISLEPILCYRCRSSQGPATSSWATATPPTVAFPAFGQARPVTRVSSFNEDLPVASPGPLEQTPSSLDSQALSIFPILSSAACLSTPLLLCPKVPQHLGCPLVPSKARGKASSSVAASLMSSGTAHALRFTMQCHVDPSSRIPCVA